jgi:hypothetical protein
MYKEGLPLRMINKDSSKHIQKEQSSQERHRAEYQTVRLFAILGILTIVFVLMIRLVQNGTIGTPRRLPASVLDSSEATKK